MHGDDIYDSVKTQIMESPQTGRIAWISPKPNSNLWGAMNKEQQAIARLRLTVEMSETVYHVRETFRRLENEGVKCASICRHTKVSE